MSDPFRIKLHNKLVDILGSKNVYYQPPETLKMSYPAIVYTLQGIPAKYADNGVYSTNRRYSVVLVTKESDPETMYRIMDLQNCSFANYYASDGLNHYAYTIHE